MSVIRKKQKKILGKLEKWHLKEEGFEKKRSKSNKRRAQKDFRRTKKVSIRVEKRRLVEKEHQKILEKVEECDERWK